MRRTLLFVTSMCIARSVFAAGDVWPIEGGKSPDGQFEVVNVSARNTNSGTDFGEEHFEIRNRAGTTIISELSLDDLTAPFSDSSALRVFADADKVLWRQDSRFVAVSTRTSKFAVHTLVFFRRGETLSRVEIPEYEPFDWEHASVGSDDNTHREPHRWLKNGDLVLDITTGYHTLSDGGITGYFATVRFTGDPPKGLKRSRTKSTDRD